MHNHNHDGTIDVASQQLPSAMLAAGLVGWDWWELEVERHLEGYTFSASALGEAFRA